MTSSQPDLTIDPPSALTPFAIREDSLASRLGVDRGWIRGQRAAAELGVHFYWGPNRCFHWSEAGATWLTQRLQSLAAIEESSVPQSPAPPQIAALPAALAPHDPLSSAILVVTRVGFRNTRVLQARTPAGVTVTVTGVNADRWWPGFLLKAIPRSADVWEYDGHPTDAAIGRRQPKGKNDHAWPRQSTNGAA
jgi:hypothetical protein